jgi:predicted secreted protein
MTMKPIQSSTLWKVVLALFLFAIVPFGVRADSSQTQLTVSNVTGTPGQDVTVFGTITNTGTVLVFLNGEGFSLGSASFLNGDVTNFFANAPASLAGGTSSGLIALFSFDIAPGTAPGVYDENFLQLLGGAGKFDQNDIADAEFSVTVKSNMVPEPGTIGMIALGLVGLLLLRRRVLERVAR